MADSPATRLRWIEENCLDPGVRETDLPLPPPAIGDDFDWQQRDFESYRLAMLGELQERFPERRRWTSGDIEAVLIEVLAYQLDQLSDMADRVSAESYLLSARRVSSVLEWLSFIAYDPVTERTLDSMDQLLELYGRKPHEMELDRRRGPASIRRQRRMVSPDDYAARIAEHPLVLRAYTKKRWNGSWLELTVAVALLNDWQLDDRLGSSDTPLSERQKAEVTAFHEGEGRDLRRPQWQHNPTIREVLADYLRAYRVVGQVVRLENVVYLGVVIELCITAREAYFQSEIRREVNRVLGCGPDGFFSPGRLAAGQDIQLSDIYEWVMRLDGVDNLEVLRFGKLGDEPNFGEVPQKIVMESDELAVCTSKGRGILSIEIRGGRRG